MSVATALNLTRETMQEVVVQRWPQWSQRLPALLFHITHSSGANHGQTDPDRRGSL